MDADNAITLDNYEVVAIPGKGVWIADSDGNCWHVGGPHEDATEANKLVRDYREAVDA